MADVVVTAPRPCATLDARDRVVARCRCVPGVPPIIRGLRRRRDRRPAGHHVPPARAGRPGGRRGVAVPVLPVPAERRGLRRVGLPRRRAHLRHPRRRRQARRPGPRPGTAGGRRHRPQPHQQRAPVVPGGPDGSPGQPRARPVPLPRRWRGRRVAAAQQLALGVRWTRLDPGGGGGRHPWPVVPAPVRLHPAGRELGLPRRARGVRSHAPVLAGPRGRRIPHRRGPRHDQGARPARLGRRPPHGRHGRDHGRRPAADVGPRGGPRDLPRMAEDHRLLRRGPHARGRGVGDALLPTGPLHPPRRAAPGVQLRPLRGAVAGRGPARGPHHVGRRLGRGGGTGDVGAEQPRHRPSRVAVRLPARLARAGRDRAVGPPAGRRARPAPGPRGHAAHARPARLGLPVPGRGAGPARAHPPAR